MPTLRSRVPRSGPTLSDFKLPELMGFFSSWLPQGHANRTRRHGDCRWCSWGEYVADARRIHAELIAKHRATARATGRPLFATCVLAYADAHGVEALSSATYNDIRSMGGENG